MDACPPLEDIAAFIDGINLSPEERARITEHLARCESCYEIFSGAVHFQEEERNSSAKNDIGGGDVITFPLVETKSKKKHVQRWLPLAASVVLAVGLGYMIWQNYRALPEVTVESVVGSLQNQDMPAEQRYQPKNVLRSGEEATTLFSTAPSFLAGIYLVDLRLSVEAGDVESTKELLYALQGEIAQVRGVHEEAGAWKAEADRMTDAAALNRFALALPQRESALENQLTEEPFFRFGIWTEGGRRSALSRSPEFFESSVNHRFLAAIPREVTSLQDARYAPVLKDLRQIGELWDRRSEDYSALARSFEDIIDRMEEIKKQDEEDLEEPF